MKATFTELDPCRAAEQRDELTPLHSITSSAMASRTMLRR
jgi:hypothetical protein